MPEISYNLRGFDGEMGMPLHSQTAVDSDQDKTVSRDHGVDLVQSQIMIYFSQIPDPASWTVG
jgi:hypothetical protein